MVFRRNCLQVGVLWIQCYMFIMIHFFTSRQIAAVSVAQGGPAPAFFEESIYNMLVKPEEVDLTQLPDDYFTMKDSELSRWATSESNSATRVPALLIFLTSGITYHQFKMAAEIVVNVNKTVSEYIRNAANKNLV